jgi:uncharacterized sulfatase
MKNQINSFVFCTIVVLGFAMHSCSAKGKTAEAPKKPNIIFYLADDQDVYDYGCYGNEKVNTPAVDRLASEGILFENAFTAQAICAPSRSQLYTGNYPLKNGCYMNHIPTKRNQVSTTNYMKNFGYEVILAGKSHVAPKEVFSWSREWQPIDKEDLPRPYLPLDSIKSYFESASKPFCMYITSEYPHGPYFDEPAGTPDDYKFFPFNDQGIENPNKLKGMAGYYRNIHEDNKQLEKILDWVDEYLDENTLFIYSADHGLSGKFTVYDRGLNVPFVVRWPSVIKPNTRSEVMIHYTDVLPTFMEIAGGKEPENIDGSSFLHVLKGQEKEIHEYVYGVQTRQNTWHTAVFPARCIRSKEYKYIINFNSEEVVNKNLTGNKYVDAFIKIGAARFDKVPYEELYNLKEDPYEQNNLAKNDQYDSIKSQLKNRLFEWMNDQDDFLAEEGHMPLLKPNQHFLDEQSKFKDVPVPDSLVNTLNDKDYYNAHY